MIVMGYTHCIVDGCPDLQDTDGLCAHHWKVETAGKCERWDCEQPAPYDVYCEDHQHALYSFGAV